MAENVQDESDEKSCFKTFNMDQSIGRGSKT